MTDHIAKRVIILVGISGSGKTTCVSALRDSCAKSNLSFASVSADDHMIDDAGNWKFDPARLGICHSICQEEYHSALKDKIDVIAVDNTNLCYEHRQAYEKAALEAGYDVMLKVLDVPLEVALERNKHGVPRHTLINQKNKLDIRPGVYHITYQEE